MNCPKCRAPLQPLEVRPGIVLLTCPGCAGGFYPKGSLTVDIKLKGAGMKGYGCPACGAALKTGTLFDGKLELDQCGACGGVWFDAAEISKLRSLSGVEGLLRDTLGPPTEAAGGGAPAHATTGPAASRPKGERPVRKTKTDDDGGTGEWREDRREDSATLENTDETRNPTAAIDGRVYRHFQTSRARVTGAVGEFPWRVAVGERARVRDFVDPPYMLSNEVTGQESVWSQGRYVPAEEVWAAFEMEGAPPPSLGVSPAQPNPYEASLGSMFITAGLAAMAALGVWGVLTAQKTNARVHEERFTYNRADPEKSRVTKDFILQGHRSNVEIRTDTNLESHWAYIDYALINADTDEALDFGREISYYEGYDEDGRWTEGSKSDTALLKDVPPGRYYLRLEPEDGDATAFNYTVAVRRDVPQAWPLVLAMFGLFLPLVWVWVRRYMFEIARWRESDHPVRTLRGKEDDD